MVRYLEEEFDSDSLNASVACPSWAPIVGFTGIACAVCFASEYFQAIYSEKSRSDRTDVFSPCILTFFLGQTLAALMELQKQDSESCPWEFDHRNC